MYIYMQYMDPNYLKLVFGSIYDYYFDVLGYYNNTSL